MVDANIFLYAAICEFNQHVKAIKLLEKWRSDTSPWHSTWGIFYEFLRVSTHAAVFEKPLTPAQAWDFLKAVLHSPGFSLLSEKEEHPSVVESLLVGDVEVKGNLWHDAHTAAVMHEHGIQEIVTADADFHRFKWLRVQNPFL